MKRMCSNFHSLHKVITLYFTGPTLIKTIIFIYGIQSQDKVSAQMLGCTQLQVLTLLVTMMIYLYRKVIQLKLLHII